MSEPYLVSLAGFTQFERDALAYCITQVGSRNPTYRLVDGFSKHDFVIADGDSHTVVAPLARDGHFHRTVFVGGSAAPDARVRVSRPIDPVRILSCLDELAAQRQTQPTPSMQWNPDPDDRLAARASTRAAVRRARFEPRTGDEPQTESAHAVLVLDEQEADRAQLCSLLTVFGFQPWSAQDQAQAAELLDERGFEAAFLALAPSESGVSGGAAICQRIRQAERAASARTTVVVVSGPAQQADRVRALLAGGDAVLTKPLGRGDVARVLETCKIRLPADPRRH